MRRPKSTLLDVALLVRTKSARNQQTRNALRDEVLNHLENPLARQFWLTDLDQYRKEDFAPVQHKLSKLLVSDTVSRMLSQPESKISLQKIMDTQQVFLANLSTVGSETREVLGKLLLSFFHLNALNRSAVSETERKPFYIFCDEAHRFLTDAIEDLLAETRKFGVGLTLAHQHLSQFDRKKVDALSTVGSALVFKVDARDAGVLTKDFMGRVSVDDFVSLEPRHCIARVGANVCHLRTDNVRSIPDENGRKRILEESHTRYYMNADELKPLNESAGHLRQPVCLASDEEEFTYDEF